MKKRLLSMLLIIAVVLSFGASAVAANSYSVQPRWNYLTFIDNNIDITSSGIAKIGTWADATSSSATAINVTASLQQLKSSGWTEVKSWSETDMSRSYGFEKSWPVYHGYSYRLVTTAKVYVNGVLKETASLTTDYGYFK